MSDLMTRERKLEEALRELLDAINSRWDGESNRRRSNAISPRMEDAIVRASEILKDRTHS